MIHYITSSLHCIILECSRSLYISMVTSHRFLGEKMCLIIPLFLKKSFVIRSLRLKIGLFLNICDYLQEVQRYSLFYFICYNVILMDYSLRVGNQCVPSNSLCFVVVSSAKTEIIAKTAVTTAPE